MMALITQFIPLEWIISLAAVIGAGFVAWFTGRRGAKQTAKIKAQADTIKAHERMNDADLGLGATDDERIKRLRDFATKHGN